MRRAFQVQFTLLIGGVTLMAGLPRAWADAGLARARNCLACHAMEQRIVGPAFKDVANRHRNDPQGIDYLAEKILRGGAGAWGPVPMPANRIPQAEARQLAAWILGRNLPAGPAASAAPAPYPAPTSPEAVRPPPARAGSAKVDSTGSGFFINHRQLITNAHVVQGCAQLRVAGKHPAQLTAIDSPNDLAALEVPDYTGRWASMRDFKVRAGEPITVVGYPLRGVLGAGPQVTAGNVTGLTGLLNDLRFMQISAPVQPGSSGGPVADGAGQVVGVVQSKLDVLRVARATGDLPQNVNFAINQATLAAFLDANQITYSRGQSREQLPTPDVAERMMPFTALVECWK